ncbi:hypothetical protein [Aestuariivirga sp.]|uniref:hypothetical protein n=1 Tax=Aestuariivirga sp. TaxID=2650926 RepID=UPI0039E256F5
MLTKGIAAAAIVAVGLVGGAVDASAKTSVHVGIGLGGWGPGYGNGWCWRHPGACGHGPGYYPAPGYYAPPPVYYAPPPAYYPPQPVYGGYGMSCGQAKSIVRAKGYYSVSTRDCAGSTYSFVGFRNGGRFLVSVNARSGNTWSRPW